MNAATLCTREVATCDRQTSIIEAAARMRVPLGVLTDRDIVLTVVPPLAAADKLYDGDVMPRPALVADGADDIWLLSRRMVEPRRWPCNPNATEQAMGLE